MIDFEKSKSVESEPRLLFKITLIRHEKPYYKDVGHDLTPEGVEGAKKTGKMLKESGRVDEEKEEIILLHSPAVRARGTMEFISESAELGDIERRSVDQLRQSDMHNRPLMEEYFNSVEGGQEEMSRDHYEHPLFNERPDVIETHDKKKERLYRAFEYLIRWFEKHDLTDKLPHIIAVSHYEVLTHIIDDVFGIENMGRYSVPFFGEQIFVDVFSTDSRDVLRLHVKYKEHEKDVFFNRNNREIEIK